MTEPRRVAVLDLAAGRTVAVVDLAFRNGHHIPGTPYEWRHGYIPLTHRIAKRYGKLHAFRERRETKVVNRVQAKNVLRSLSDQTVGRIYEKYSHRPGVTNTVARELDRRDRRDRAAKKMRQLREEHRRVVHAQFLQAESETRGNLLSRAGRDAGVHPESLFTGPERRAHKYASEELLKFWDRNPRLTAAEFLRQSRQHREAA